MSWTNIRLELARSSQFPKGSPHRCYLLHLPLDPGGLIDAAMVGSSPRRATVRRFWPSQPDLRGYVVNTPQGWAFAYDAREEADERVCHLDSLPFRVGNTLTVTEPDGERLPFTVTNAELLD